MTGWRPLLNRLVAGLMLTMLLPGCSRVGLLYNMADLLAKQYASDYLNLASEQVSRWEPNLERTLARHRAEELPRLAGFLDQFLETSREGFDANNARCLIGGVKDLYKRHARLAVDLTAPLLAGLTPTQIQALERRFREEEAEDAADLAERDGSREKIKRARRYTRSIEDWTGKLRPEQAAIVAEVAVRMPDAEAAVTAYRALKRQQLLDRLKGGADSEEIDEFLSAWLIAFADLPPELEDARLGVEASLGDLLIRLGDSLDETQRAHLEQRLRQLRDDLLNLQPNPRLLPLSC